MYSQRKTLLLSAAFEPIRVLDPKRLFSMLLRDCVIVLETYEDGFRSTRESFPLPSVVALKKNYYYRKRVRCARRNIYIRDGYRCAYCGIHADELPEKVRGLTLDHVFPESRGGVFSFENLVTACRSCNWYKGDNTPTEAGMFLRIQPKVPRPHPKFFSPVRKPEFAPEPWRNYLICG